MKKLITPILKYGINKAKRSKFIQNIFEAPFDLSKFPIKGTFTDSKGNTFQLLDGLRSRIKPGWQKALSDKPAYVAQDQLGTFKGTFKSVPAGLR